MVPPPDFGDDNMSDLDSDLEHDDYFNDDAQPLESVFLLEDEDCIELKDAYWFMSNWEKNQYKCMDNPKSCSGGCCRLSDHVWCDDTNAWPHLPCICNQNTAANHNKENNSSGNIYTNTNSTPATEVGK